MPRLYKRPRMAVPLAALVLALSLPAPGLAQQQQQQSRGLGRRILQSSLLAQQQPAPVGVHDPTHHHHQTHHNGLGGGDVGSQLLFPESGRIAPGPQTDRCTTMIVGPKATADGSTMTTHTADCAECDFRLAKVPARDWPKGAQRPVYLFASAYPRRVQVGRSETWEPDNLDDSLPQADAWTRPGFSKVLGHIPQVEHTYALIEGLYAIENEHQVAIGESTCSGRFWAKPKGVDGGTALLEIGELSAIALERCKTARCAIQTMGDLASEYGYYGAQWDGQMDDIIAEAGEALTVGDPKEAWVFHILPDDQGTSAIWAAQRVPDDHISLVANQFTIREIPKDGTKGKAEHFMHSSNLWDVAQRNGLWSPDQGDLDFLKVYGYMRVHAAYATRRVWRVFSLAAPSLGIKPITDDFGDSYPFSVRPDALLTPQDLMRYQRDHYEGTQYDLTQGVAAGPYGDPNRYDPAANKGENVTLKEAGSGFYERSISLFRTSYSTVTQSRAALPNMVGARVWVCQYMPAMSTYTPLYVANDALPPSYTTGSLFKYAKDCNYWAAAVVGNWATRFYRYIREDVQATQAAIEPPLALQMEESETQALARLATGDMDGAAEVLRLQAEAAASVALATWTDLFEFLIARYRDGYKVKDMLSPLFEQEYLFYPLWWLEISGFFNHTLTMKDPEPLPAAGSSQKGKKRKEKKKTSQQLGLLELPPGVEGGREGVAPSVVVVVVGFVAGLSMAVGFWLGRTWTQREAYTTLRL